MVNHPKIQLWSSYQDLQCGGKIPIGLKKFFFRHEIVMSGPQCADCKRKRTASASAGLTLAGVADWLRRGLFLFYFELPSSGMMNGRRLVVAATNVVGFGRDFATCFEPRDPSQRPRGPRRAGIGCVCGMCGRERSILAGWNERVRCACVCIRMWVAWAIAVWRLCVTRILKDFYFYLG